MKFSRNGLYTFLVLVFLLGGVAHAEDIDIFAGTKETDDNDPNIVFVLDNSANWSKDSQKWPDGTQGQSEVEALKTVLAAQVDKINIGLIEYNTESDSSDRDGGYIDNVFGHTPDTAVNDVDFPSRPAGGNTLPAGWGTKDNSASVEKNWNDAETQGARLHLLWDMSDRWSTNLTAMAQSTESGADNDYDPFVGDLQTVRFHDEWAKDDFEMYSFVVNGDLGFAQLVASASYLDRTFDTFSDITLYGLYWAANYCHDSYYTTADADVYDHDDDIN